MSLNLDKSTWTRVKFGDVVRNVNDYFDPDRDGIFPYVSGPHITVGEATVSSYGSTDDDKFPPTFKRKFQTADVLLHTRGIEKLAAVDRDGVTGEKLFVLRSIDAGLLRQEFLIWLLQGPQAQAYMRDHFTGSVNKFLNWGPLAVMEFNLPPLDEQKRISDLLWAIEAHVHALRLISRQIEADESLDGLGRLLFEERTSGEAVVRIADAVKLSSGSFLPAKAMVPGEVPVYGGNGVSGYHDEAKFDQPKVMVGRVGAYCGAVHQTTGPSWITDNALVVKKSVGYRDSFLAAALRHARLNQFASHTAQPAVSATGLGGVEIVQPRQEDQADYLGSRAKVVAGRDATLNESAAVATLRFTLLTTIFGGP